VGCGAVGVERPTVDEARRGALPETTNHA
jgi:hypothetical protein